MKKLFTFVAVAFTVSCMAANCTWSAGSVGSTFDGGTAYIVEITGSTLTAAQIAAKLEADGISATTPTGYSVYSIKGTVEGVDSANVAYWGDYAAYNAGQGYGFTTSDPTASSANVFVIVMDATNENFIMSDIVQITAGDQLHIGMDDNWAIDASEWTQKGSVGNVPEPTVLALLALGVAGVALRRKKVVA